MTSAIPTTSRFRFEITPLPNESMRACSAIAQAAMSPSRGSLVLFALYAGVSYDVSRKSDAAAGCFIPETTSVTLLSEVET